MSEGNEGLFLGPEDIKILFTLLKSREYALSNAERQLLLKIENTLYTSLSVDEAETLLSRTQAGAGSPFSGRRGE
jgi:hypothetical protein